MISVFPTPTDYSKALFVGGGGGGGGDLHILKDKTNLPTNIDKKKSIPIKESCVTFLQCCGAATFLSGSGSGSPRCRGRSLAQANLGAAPA